jgi:hypothetical protein
MIHIILTNEEEYLVVEPYQINETFYGHIHFRSKSIDNARKYANMLNENMVAANAIAAGPGGSNIATFTPIMKFRNALSRVQKRRKPK